MRERRQLQGSWANPRNGASTSAPKQRKRQATDVRLLRPELPPIRSFDPGGIPASSADPAGVKHRGSLALSIGCELGWSEHDAASMEVEGISTSQSKTSSTSSPATGGGGPTSYLG